MTVSGQPHTPPRWQIMSGVADVVFILFMSHGAFSYGGQLLPDVSSEDTAEAGEHQKLSSERIIIIILGMYVGAICVPMVLFLPRYCWLSLILAPAGAFLRYQSCARLNGFLGIPFGLLIANISATLITAVLHSSSATFESDWPSAVITGFCGSLSSLSAMIVDLAKLPRAHAVIYFGVSICCAQAVCLTSRLVL